MSKRAFGTVLGAMTSQQLPVVLKISPNGRTLRLASAALDLKCTSGDEVVLPGIFVRVPLEVPTVAVRRVMRSLSPNTPLSCALEPQSTPATSALPPIAGQGQASLHARYVLLHHHPDL